MNKVSNCILKQRSRLSLYHKKASVEKLATKELDHQKIYTKELDTKKAGSLIEELKYFDELFNVEFSGTNNFNSFATLFFQLFVLLKQHFKTFDKIIQEKHR